ncbi:MAG TPA: dephospho-CoA kinase, partial [Ilumatobacteraceae bacterium]|nr:dephospho-CoA kinase [Ilumatobacteraceae bacterium]
MIVVGLTGGIGSGKSSVSARLAALGAVIVDADATTRRLQEPGGSLYVKIVERFGPEVVAADGTLDRAKIAAMVFPSPELLAELNAITHPGIGAELREQMRAHVDNIDFDAAAKFE